LQLERDCASGYPTLQMQAQGVLMKKI
jgi:hypothetical protein